jgi:2-iminobutanoate/2-iminopropanoate deaminase
MKLEVKTKNAPQATGPFSQAVVRGNLIFTSEQIYLTPDGNLLDDTLEKQIHQVMSNLKSILLAAGLSFKDVVKSTIYVTDMSLYSKINEVYGTYFSKPFPAREVVCVKELPLNSKLEISMVAIKS